ncbi:MAG: hypothetical protein FH758_10055 [Firmicutes bacterium]|nr:hypothetical protein [Bacillota bacterium]
MFKRFLEGLFLLCLIAGGFYWYSSSYNLTPNTALFALATADDQHYSDYALEFTCPDGWQVSKEEVEGKEILHHVTYIDPGGRSHGFVQIWAASKPLEKFLKESLNSPADVDLVKNLNMKPCQLGTKEGYLVSYERSAKDQVVAKEFFFVRDKCIYRISLFVKEGNWSENDEEVFNELVSSLTVKY